MDNKHNNLNLAAKICSDICPWTLSVRFSEQIMYADKYPSIFSRQMKAIVYLSACIFDGKTYRTFKASFKGWFLDRIVLIILQIGISYLWKWMNPITNYESQQRNVYGSLINPEEHENSEASDIGDKSTCKTFIHCQIHWRNICPCCYLLNGINIFILTLSGIF